MNPITISTLEAFDFDTRALWLHFVRLQEQAVATLNGLELLADTGNRKAEKLLNAAWNRYTRRTVFANQAGDMHWEAL